MILWGTDFSKIQLRQMVYDEVFNSGSLDEWVSLAHHPIAENSETVTSYDGSTTYQRGTDYQMDYENGRILCLSTGSIPPETDLKIDYEYIAQEYQFTSSDGFQMWIEWVREIAGRMKTQSGRIIESKLGWRLVWKMKAMEIDAYSLSDFLRMVALWEGADKRVILFPRPGNLPGYEMVNPERFGLDFLANKWIGVGLEIQLISRNLFPEIPPHTGGTGDA